MNEAQLHYLTSVLGIQEFLRPPMQESLAESGARLFVLLPLPASDFPLRQEIAELLAKMLRAMKLEPDEVISGEWVAPRSQAEPPEQILRLIERARAEVKPLILFACADLPGLDFGRPVEPGEWVEFQGLRILYTHSPIELFASPQKKAAAWAHLKEMMKAL